MKRCAVCLLLLFLTGCGEPKELNEGIALRSRLLQASEVSFSVTATADDGSCLQTFAMDCKSDKAGNVAFTVTRPESISGIRGTLSSEGGRLTFDRTALDFGLLAEERLSPVSAPWILLNALRSGNLTSACREEEMIRLSLDDSYAEDALQLDVWLDSGGMPVRADVLCEGSRILSLDVRDFVIV